MQSTESRFVIGPSNILFAGVYIYIYMCVLFSLEIVQAGAVKGLITTLSLFSSVDGGGGSLLVCVTI